MAENFKGENYPVDISIVLTDMQRYVAEIDHQLSLREPQFLKDYLAFGDKNKINRKKFEETFGLNNYLKTDSKKASSGQPNEIKGLYALAELCDGKPLVLNVGISQSIIRRFYQHTCGKKHNESTLGFYMALHKHNEPGKEKYIGKRESFPYADYRDACLDEIRNLRFAIIPINNNFELYMAEVYLACHYKAYWNTFETH